MKSFVTRFDDISEVEDWIAAGIPVISFHALGLARTGPAT